MANDENKTPFGGLNIQTIESGLGMIMPGSGDPGGDKKDTEKNQNKAPATGADYFNQKMMIPETEDEIRQFQQKDSKGGKSKEGNEEVTDPEKNKGKGGEDVIIDEDSPLYLHAATLHEEGILPTLDLNELKGKPFNEAMQVLLTKQKEYIDGGRSEYQNSLSERQKEFLEMIELGIPEEQAENTFRYEDAYSKLTDQVLADNEELQKQVIVQALKLQGLNDSKIKLFLKAAETEERVFEEAKDARDGINAYIANEKKRVIDEAKVEQERRDQEEVKLQGDIKSTIDKIDEILPGIKVSANEKTALYNSMTKPVDTKVVDGKRIPVDLVNKTRDKDKIMFDIRLKYFIQLGLFEDKADLSRIMKKVTSSNAQKLAEKLTEEAAAGADKGIKFEKGQKKDEKQKIIFPTFK